jgi:D-glycero-alpha-D-manno-heptose-7-phosphate kinase
MYARAPLRIGFGGGGTDLFPFRSFYGGCTLSVTIRKYACAEFDGRDNSSSLISAIKKRLDCEKNIDIDVEAPPYSGLGASAAIAVSTIGLIANGSMTKSSIAELAFDIERKDLKISGGAQDQYCSAIGGFNFYTYDKDAVHVFPVTHTKFLDSLEKKILIVFIMKREMGGSGSDVQKDTLDRDNDKNLLDIKETCLNMRKAMQEESLECFGRILDTSWQQKKRLSPYIANEFILKVEKEVKRAGAYGFKLSGAGGGGYAAIVCDNVGAVRERLFEMGLMPEGVRFDWDGLIVRS